MRMQREFSINDKPTRNGMYLAALCLIRLAKLGIENIAPRKSHRPARSQEGRDRKPGMHPSRGDTLDIFADPPARRPAGGRPRRNSDSSVADRNSKAMDPEEERRRRERRHREHEHKHKDSKGRPIPVAGPKKPSKRLDTIDKLDVTSIFGTGGRSSTNKPFSPSKS